ncbi:MAG: GDSL-type esterase/lipase family protein [Eubacteriales bacterium]
MKNILCFGDCNTFGKDAHGNRFPRHIRWTGKTQQLLGEDFYLIEEGLEGRTTIWDDPLLPHRCGMTALPISLLTHKPLDLVVLSLGTNDCKRYFRVSAEEIASGMEELVKKIQSSTGISKGKTTVLILAPVPIGEKISRSKSLEYDETSRMKSLELGSLYQQIATLRNCAFLDASNFATVGSDHLHLEEESHLRTAEEMAKKIQEMFS